MHYTIDEVGKNIKLKNMKIGDVSQATKWDKHIDRLYADYDFPSYDNFEIVRWYKKKTQKNKIIISILDFKDNLIGYITVRKINRFFKTAEMGIVLNPSKVGMSYGSEAINLLSNWYFKKLCYKKLYLSVAMYNLRAYKAYKRSGFVEKKYIYEPFYNTEIDLFNDKKYELIKKYFKKTSSNIYVKCIRMELSTKNLSY